MAQVDAHENCPFFTVDRNRMLRREKREGVKDKNRNPFPFCVNALKMKTIYAQLFSAILFATPCLVSGQVISPSSTSIESKNQTSLDFGRILLEKIDYLSKNISLKNPGEVMGYLGIHETKTWVYPTNTRITPVGKDGNDVINEVLAGSGMTYVAILPIINDPRSNRFARLDIVFNPAEACIHIDDVQRIFLGAQTKIISPSWASDPKPQPPRAHDIGALTFSPIQTPLGLIGSITFSFKYQPCAESVGIGYKSN